MTITESFLPCQSVTRSPFCQHQEASSANTAHPLSALSSRLWWRKQGGSCQIPAPSVVPVSQTSQAAKMLAVLSAQHYQEHSRDRGMSENSPVSRCWEHWVHSELNVWEHTEASSSERKKNRPGGVLDSQRLLHALPCTGRWIKHQRRVDLGC